MNNELNKKLNEELKKIPNEVFERARLAIKISKNRDLNKIFKIMQQLKRGN